MVISSASARERQRQRVKVRYYRSVDEISKARSLVQTLSQQHAAVVARHQQQSNGQDRMAVYADAVALAAQLRTEKKYLMRLLEQHQVVQDRVTNLMDEYDGVAEVYRVCAACMRWITVANQTLQVNRGTSDESLPFSFESLGLQDCTEFVGAAVVGIRQFLRSQAFVSTNTSLFGWRDRRQIVGDEIRISVQKIIHGHTPLELFLRAWKMLSNPTEFAQLYSESLGFKAHCIQTVDDSNVVYFTQFPGPDPSASFHCLFLLSRLRIKDGYATLYQSIDPSRFVRRSAAQASAVELWIDLKMWCVSAACVLASEWIFILVAMQDHPQSGQE